VFTQHTIRISSHITAKTPRYLICQQSHTSVALSPVLSNLDLESSGGSSSTGFLEFASLRLDVWFLVLVGSETEMLNSLSGILWSSEEKSVASCRSTESQLIESQDLTSSSKNACAGSSCESQSCNAKLGDGQKTIVICDSANDDDSLVVGLLRGVADDSGDGDGGSVDTGHKESAEDNLVEG